MGALERSRFTLRTRIFQKGRTRLSQTQVASTLTLLMVELDLLEQAKNAGPKALIHIFFGLVHTVLKRSRPNPTAYAGCQALSSACQSRSWIYNLFV